LLEGEVLLISLLRSYQKFVEKEGKFLYTLGLKIPALAENSGFG